MKPDPMDEDIIQRLLKMAHECKLLGIEDRIQPDTFGDRVSFGMLKYMQGLEETDQPIDHRVLQFIIAPLASHVGRLERRIGELEAVIQKLGVG